MSVPKLSCFSPDGSKFAQVGSDGTLRVWDAKSSLFDHEFRPAEHLSARISCVRFSPQWSKKSKKRKKGDPENQVGKCFLALGTVSGSILLYEYKEQEVVATLTHCESAPVVDLAWKNWNILYSLAENKTVVQWSALKKEKIRTIDVSGNSSLCLLDNHLVVGSHDIHMTSLANEKDAKNSKKFTGHSSTISLIHPLMTKSQDGVEKESGSTYFVSSADDRFVYTWCTEAKGSHPMASLLVKDVPTSISSSRLVDKSSHIVVTTHKGKLLLFSLKLNEKKSKPFKSCSVVNILTSENDRTSSIPIIGSHFLNNKEMIIVYSSSMVLKFEQIQLQDLKGEVDLVRNPSASSIDKESSLLKTVTPKITKDAIHLRPGSMDAPPLNDADEDEDSVLKLPMEDRLNALAIGQPIWNTTAPPRADNLTQLLLQGLHSKDQALLGSVLSQGDNEEVVNNTIRRLPVQAVVPLIKYLQTLTGKKGHKGFTYIAWLQAILYHHMSHLSTLSERQSLMQPFYVESGAMMTTVTKFIQLQARLDLILTQVANRHQDINKNAEPEALLVYKDDSSDEEIGNVTMDYGAVSESDDNWDDFDDVNAPLTSDDDSEMETEDPTTRGIKHPADENEDDDQIVVSEGDDNTDTESDSSMENGLVIASGESSDDD